MNTRWIFGRPAGRRLLATAMIPVSFVVAMVTSSQAQAADCGGSAISARFSEASQYCGAPATISPSNPDIAEPPVVSAMEPVTDSPVSLPEVRAVSISMPGFTRRLDAAVTQVRAGGGTSAPDALVVAIGQRYRIDPHLLASMVATESAGNPRAVSHKGALGLMQVMPDTARSLGVRNPSALLTDRTLALATGAAYLKKLQGQFGNNVPLVVAAYNAGPGAVMKYKGVPRYRETQGYVRTVLGRYTAARSHVGTGTATGAIR